MALQALGKTVMARNGHVLGLIAVTEQVRPTAKATNRALRALSIQPLGLLLNLAIVALEMSASSIIVATNAVLPERTLHTGEGSV